MLEIIIFLCLHFIVFCLFSEVADSDILMSYANPNYGFGLDAGVGSLSHDNNGNISQEQNKTMDDSGDSAISSPETDSCLASPLVGRSGQDDAPSQSMMSSASSRSRDGGLCVKMKQAVKLYQMDEFRNQHEKRNDPNDDDGQTQEQVNE